MARFTSVVVSVLATALAAQAPDPAAPKTTAPNPAGSPPAEREARDPEAFDLEARFAAAQPPLAEARWTLVPWRHSLTEALAEAKRDRKPVYLFVNDGDVESGRC